MPENEEHAGRALMHTKVLIDTFVQWIRPCTSGLITTINSSPDEAQQEVGTRKGYSWLVLNDEQVELEPPKQRTVS